MCNVNELVVLKPQTNIILSEVFSSSVEDISNFQLVLLIFTSAALLFS